MSIPGQTSDSQAPYSLGAATNVATETITDIHICGGCKLTFNDVELFITHKRHSCPVLSSNSSNSLNSSVITSTSSAGGGSLTSTLVPVISSSLTSNVPFQSDVLLHSQNTNETVQNQSLGTVNSSRLADMGLNISQSFTINQEANTHLNHQHSPSVSSTQMGIGRSLGSNKLVKPRGTPIKRFKCENAGCSYLSAYQKDLERHMRTHTGERPFECNMCGKTFNRSDKLKMHHRWHTGDKPYKCLQCDYSTGDSSSLKKHLRIHSDERPFRCQICPYASRNSSQLVVHLRTHTGDAPFMCHICNAKFKINSDLKRHVRMHTGEKPFKCELCNYRCAIKGNLKTHLRINHSDENHLKCDRCEFSSSSRRLLRDHLKSHDMKPVKCSDCSYTCATKTALRNHCRVHSDERPFKCDYCMYSSRQTGNVRTHIKKRHPERLKSKKRQHKSSQTREDLDSKDEEIIIKKGKGRPFCQKAYKCELCEAGFVRDDSFRSHMRQHRELAQTQENLALAVLQLQNPLNIGSSTQSFTNNTVSVTTAGQGDTITIMEVPTSVQVIEQATEVIEQAMQQSGIMPMRRENKNNAPIVTSSNLNNQDQSSNILSSYSQQRIPIRHQTAQSAKYIAYVQNQHNMAIEANNQNAAIAALQAVVNNQSQSNVTMAPTLPSSQTASLHQQGVNIQPQMMYHVQSGVNILSNLQLPFLSVNNNQPQLFTSTTQQSYAVATPQVITTQAVNPQSNIQYVLQPSTMTSTPASTITTPVYNTIVVSAPQILSSLSATDTLVENTSQITVPNSSQFTNETGSQILNIHIVPNDNSRRMPTRTVVVPTRTVVVPSADNSITITMPSQASSQITHSVQTSQPISSQVTTLPVTTMPDNNGQLHVANQSSISESDVS